MPTRILSLLFIVLMLASCATERSIRRPIEATKQEDLPSSSKGELTKVDPLPPRAIVDDARAGELFQEGRKLWNEGQKDLAIAKLNSYLATYPQGQFVDSAGIFLGQYWVGMKDPTKALPYLEKVMLLDPPSPLIHEARLLKAQSFYSLGNNAEALGVLEKIDPLQLNAKYHSSFYTLWADAAYDSGSYRDASLAYLKLHSRLRKGSPEQRVSDEKIKDIVTTKLSEDELVYILNEYGAKGFPANIVQLRLARVKLGQGSRYDAETYLNNIIGYEPPNSPYRIQAQQILQNIKFSGSQSVFKIGALFPLSGKYESWGIQFKNGLEMALHSAGLQTIPDIVYADAGPSIESATRAFERLISEDRVSLVLGPPSGNQALELATLSNRYAVPFISLSPRSGILDTGPYSFRFAVSAEAQAQAVVNYSWDALEARRFAILFPQDSFGESFARPYFDAIRGRGGEVVAAESYEPGTSDFQVLVRNMIGMAFPSFRSEEQKEEEALLEERLGRKPRPRELQNLKLPPIVDFDVLFIPDTYKTVGQILPALVFDEIKDIKLFGPSTWHSARLLGRAGQFMENAFVVDVYSNQRPSDKVSTFEKEYRLKFGEAPSSYSAMAFDLGLSLAHVLKTSHEIPGREQIKISLENAGKIAGVLGVHNWSASRDALTSMQLFQVKRGAFRYIGDVSVE